MISFTWCDWTWKSTIIKKILNLKSWAKYKYIHYYHLVQNKTSTKASKTKTKRKNNNTITLIKELIYSIVFLLYLIFLVYVKREKIILDRTFFDVKVDTQSRLKSKIALHWFWIIDTIFILIFKKQLHILLTTNSFKTNLSRKNDETSESMKYKFKQYKKIRQQKYYIINTENNTIQQSLWTIEKL